MPSPITREAIQRALARAPARHPAHDGRLAAIAAIIDRQGDVLFIRRAERDGDPWSGHVSFPGGKVEPGDEDTLAAAIRETREEIGLELARGQSLGALDDVGTPRGIPKLVVRPWVFFVDELGPTRPNEEVASVHRFSLEALQVGSGRGTFELELRGARYTLPRVDFAGMRLWGMTLRVVDDLLHRLDGRGLGLARPASPS